MNDSMVSALAELLSALERAGIRHAIGGSLASSAHGAFRATLDADLVAAISMHHVRPLCAALGRGWYADAAMIEDALCCGRSFNLIHIGSAFKFDIFPATDPFRHSQLERAQSTELPASVPISCPVTTAEDILLAKLRWYRDGGEVSERQWNDIGGLLAANAEFDWEYVTAWAARLGVSDLLDRARREAQT